MRRQRSLKHIPQAHRQRCRNVLGRELLCHAGRLGTTANRRTADHALHRRTIGAVTMGIAGSFCDAGVLQKYFGIRAEWVDEVEILRRISIGI